MFRKKDNQDKFNNLDDIIELMVHRALNKFKRKTDLNYLISSCEESIDNMIIEAKEKEHLNYVDGVFSIKYLKEYLIISVECYFQNNNKNWVKKASENKINASNFIDESLKELETEKILTFNIASPIK